MITSDCHILNHQSEEILHSSWNHRTGVVDKIPLWDLLGSAQYISQMGWTLEHSLEHHTGALVLGNISSSGGCNGWDTCHQLEWCRGCQLSSLLPPEMGTGGMAHPYGAPDNDQDESHLPPVYNSLLHQSCPPMIWLYMLLYLFLSPLSPHVIQYLLYNTL